MTRNFDWACFYCCES